MERGGWPIGCGVVCGALIQCSFGAAPVPLTILPQNRVLCGGMPLATVQDFKPFMNILPFGLCSNPANPTVAAATAAKLGVMTPMPCIPATASPWLPGSPKVLVGGMPAVNDGCKLMCSYGGVITVTMPGQLTVQL